MNFIASDTASLVSWGSSIPFSQNIVNPTYCDVLKRLSKKLCHIKHAKFNPKFIFDVEIEKHKFYCQMVNSARLILVYFVS
jgi:hypothetical protein